MNSSSKEKLPPGVILRDHVYDGIEEYDQKLPNWWLYTLYGAIIFTVLYWFYFFSTQVGLSDQQRLAKKMQEVRAIQMAGSMDNLDDTLLWEMSRNPQWVEAGKKTFMTNCASCHGHNLEGGIGVNLVDSTWLHGGNPMAVRHTITYGVLEKGMQNWGPVLGDKKIAELVAFIMSHHKAPTE